MKIGFIGLGNVGGKLAGTLLRNGHALTVRDLNPQLLQSFEQRGAAIGDGGDHAAVVIEQQEMLRADRLCLGDEKLLLIGEGLRQRAASGGVGGGVAFGTGTGTRENRQNYHQRELK